MASTDVVAGQQVRVGGRDYTVAEKCSQDQGRWACATHDEIFPNNLTLNGHVDTGQHTVTWICFEHGPEVP